MHCNIPSSNTCAKRMMKNLNIWYCTSVRWLSKGNCLRHFVALWDSDISFLSGTELGQKLSDAKCVIFYLMEIFDKLQGKDSILLSCKEGIALFNRKLKLFWLILGRWKFAKFPSLGVTSSELTDDDLVVYVKHLKQLHDDLQARFSDLLQVTVPHWFVDPFVVYPYDVHITKENFVKLQNETTAQARSNTEDVRSCG